MDTADGSGRAAQQAIKLAADQGQALDSCITDALNGRFEAVSSPNSKGDTIAG